VSRVSAGVRPVESSDTRRAGGDAPQASTARPPTDWRRTRRVLRAAAAVPVVVVLVSQRGSLLSASKRIGGLSPAWLVLALGAETVSFLAAAELQHYLLASTGIRVDRRALIALSYAGTAIAATLPAGPAVSSRYTYRALLRRGTTAGTAAWVLGATAVLSMVALALLGLIGAQLRGLGVLCSIVGGVVGLVVLTGATSAVAALVWASRHRQRLEELAFSVSAACRSAGRVVSRRTYRAAPAGPGGVCSRREAGDDRDDATLGPGRVGVALGLASANWMADVAALAVAFVALGLEVPWQGLLLAYAVTQLVTSIPLLPGSIGVAEGSMAAALVCSGVRPTAAVAGVLVYRLVSFWLVLPAGWLACRCLKRGEARSPGLMPRLPRLPSSPGHQPWAASRNTRAYVASDGLDADGPVSTGIPAAKRSSPCDR
jgi:uncharacterized membrane protein YbhN (UPF0104 family)